MEMQAEVISCRLWWTWLNHVDFTQCVVKLFLSDFVSSRRKTWFRVGCPLLGVEQNNASLELEGHGSREGSLGLPPWRDGGKEEGMNLGFILAPEPGLYLNDPRVQGSESVKWQQSIVLLVTLCFAVTGPLG